MIIYKDNLPVNASVIFFFQVACSCEWSWVNGFVGFSNVTVFITCLYIYTTHIYVWTYKDNLDSSVTSFLQVSCACGWSPNNGFVGFSNVTVAVCTAFAAVNFIAAALNVHDELPPPRKPLEISPISPTALRVPE